MDSREIFLILIIFLRMFASFFTLVQRKKSPEMITVV